jgi:hypothetical protein
MQLLKDLHVLTKYQQKNKNLINMKTRILFFSLFVLGILLYNPAFAEDEERKVPTFSEVALKISANVYIEQGKNQSVKIVAKPSTLENIITEVKDRTLNIKFPGKSIFQRNFNPGKIEIYITVPEIDGLSVSGSGNIQAEEIDSRIIDLAVSGSGDITIEELKAKRVKASVSGSGNIKIEDGGVADEFVVSISGSGNVRAEGFEADEVSIHTSGSGNCSVTSNGSIKARVSGSGNVTYRGNPSIDSSVAGSGRVKKM